MPDKTWIKVARVGDFESTERRVVSAGDRPVLLLRYEGGARAVRAHAPYPGAVVVHLGSNGTVDRADLDALLGELRDVPEVVLVTVQLRGGRSWEGQANGEITAARSRWPNVRVADWKAASDPHPEYTGEDGIHLSSSGAQAYAATIAAAL